MAEQNSSAIYHLAGGFRLKRILRSKPYINGSFVVGRIMAVVIALIIGFGACTPSKQAAGGQGDGNDYFGSKRLRLEDITYEPQIRTILFYPWSTAKTSVLDPPVLFLGDNTTHLRLEFDELGNQYQNYFFKIVPCNYDWQPAILNDLEFLDSFNEFSVTDYEISVATRVPFTHYRLEIPDVKLSGNYVVQVYRNQDPNDLIITRRFMVYENLLNITPDIKFSLDPARRFQDQQLDFTINYRGLAMFTPDQQNNLHVVVRQNYRWDAAIYNLKPMFNRIEDNLLDYHFFNNENVLPGGNEYRIVDLRSMRFLGMGMTGYQFDNEKAEIVMDVDKSRNEVNYNQWIDINGMFIPMNFETQSTNVAADYVFTNFRLKTKYKLPEEVYVFGKMSDWRLDPRFKMTYDSASSTYFARVLLKQGYYNYEYAIRRAGTMNADATYLEGTHSMTENLYDWLVYFRSIGARYDRLIGYQRTDYFGRRSSGQ